jgi:ABC-2 type transport system permease protein
MSFALLVKDEMRGFYKSKVMIFLWIGLPLLTILFHFWSSLQGGELPFTALSAIITSSIGGTLASVMLTVSIINERIQHVYDLFLVRPVKRWNIIVSKFLAVYACIAVASLLSLLLGLIIDYVNIGEVSETVLNDTALSLVTSLSMMAVSSSTGVLIGVAAPSVLVGVILVIYGGNQVSALPMIPTILNISNAMLFTVTFGAVTASIMLVLATFLFNRKQL